jgi:rhamnogalacturonyl hydrolase YesR
MRIQWASLALIAAACSSTAHDPTIPADASVALPGPVDAANAPDDATAAPDLADGRAEIEALMEKVADWQIAQYGSRNPNGWIDATFYAGLLAAYRVTHAQRFVNRANAWAEANHWTLGGDQSPDWQCAGRSYVDLYLQNPIAGHLSPTQTVVDGVIAAGKPGRQVWWWCDALFMAPPTFARLGTATGQAKYFDRLSAMWWDVTSALFDMSSSLYSRDASYLNKTCPNGQKMFWSRGNGWVMAGLVRVLEDLPASHSDRGRFITLFRTMSARVATLQKPDGYWPSCLTDAKDYAEPETSGTSAFVYAMAWGINHGQLDRATYLPVVRRGWSALVAAVDADGRLGWVQPVGAAPGPSTAGDTFPYGVGLFLLAASEVAQLGG